MKKLFPIFLLVFLFFPNPYLVAQELHQDIQGIWKAKVSEVISQEERILPGMDTVSTYQTIRAEILEGEREGQTVTIENDFILLEKGDKFFLFYTRDIDGREMYSVRDIDRRATLIFFTALFIITILVFGGKQGLRSLVSLAGSFFVIMYIMVPGLLAGYPPVITSVLIAAIILFFAIYFTHGFNRESTVAFMGTVSAVILTGILAYLGVAMAHLTGFASDEAIYLNFNTGGLLDFAGLLLGGIIIGALGVLDDIAVTQAAVVSEIYSSASHLSAGDVYRKALRVGKEHVGALVNTLALAYTGASLPLLLLFSVSESSISSIINQEIFAVEIIRIIAGSIGLILAVPLTTLLAVHMLKGYKSKSSDSHNHPVIS